MKVAKARPRARLMPATGLVGCFSFVFMLLEIDGADFQSRRSGMQGMLSLVSTSPTSLTPVNASPVLWLLEPRDTGDHNFRNRKLTVMDKFVTGSTKRRAAERVPLPA